MLLGPSMMLGDESSIPEIFLLADRAVRDNPTYAPPIKRPPKPVPCPSLDSPKFVRGPIVANTQEYIDNWNKERQDEKDAEARERRKVQELNIINLLAQKNNKEKRMLSLDKGKTKDMKKIAALHFEIKDLDEQLGKAQEESGIVLEDINTGSTLGRFWHKVKATVKKYWNKAKKFVKKNKDLFIGIATIAAPVIIWNLFKRFILRI